MTFSEEPSVKLPVNNCTFSLASCLPFSVGSRKPCAFLSCPPDSQVSSVCFCSLSRSALAPLSLTLLRFTLTLPGIPPMSIRTRDPLLTYRSAAPFQGSFPTLLLLFSLPSGWRGFPWLCGLLSALQEQKSPGPAVAVPVLHVRVESPRSAGRTRREHLRN